jgi:hypothetical protein
LSLIAADAGDTEILESFANAASQAGSPEQMQKWKQLLWAACHAIQQKWDRTARMISSSDLEALAKAYKYADPKPVLPDLRSTWNALDEQFRESLRRADPDDPADFNYDPFDRLTAFAHGAKQCLPQFLAERGFPDRYESEIAEVLSNAKAEVDIDLDDSDAEELRYFSERASTIASSLGRLHDLSVDPDSDTYKLSKRLDLHSSTLEEWATEMDNSKHDENGEEDDSESDSYESTSREAIVFNIDMLFSEL